MTFPTIRPALTLDFAKTQLLDPRITFSRSSDGTYLDSDGLIKTAPDGVARFEYDSNGKCLGLLIEESRTNLFTYGTTLQTNWATNQGTKTTGAAISPDGTLNATKLTPNTTTSSHYFSQTVTVGGGVAAFSVYAKADGYDYIQLYTSNGNAVFNVATGEVVSAPLVTADIQAIGNGWYRCEIYDWTPISPTSFRLYSSDNSTVSNFAGDGVSGTLFWGAQVEAAAFPTSFIPTAGSTVTRAADLATMPTAGIYGDESTTINKDFGTASTGTTLSIIGPNTERTVTYPAHLTQTEINEVTDAEDDDFWRWRVVGSSFALASFTTDGQVTVDWGDGTIEVLTTAEHTFADGAGYHDIGFRLDSGTKFAPTIAADTTHSNKVIAVGPCPESMLVNASNAFYFCTNLKVVDPTGNYTDGASWANAFRNCSSLTSFPLVDTSGVTNFGSAWKDCSTMTSFAKIDTSSATGLASTWLNCYDLESFPAIDTSSVTNFGNAWYNCSSLTSFPFIDTSSATTVGLPGTWRNCSSLTSFPLLDTSNAETLSSAWFGCSSLTSFPLINTSNVTSFASTWRGCSSLTSFPLLDTSSATNFNAAWLSCASLTTFPANFFDSWAGTPADSCFVNAWDACASLSATSVENILNSIDTSGQSAPASGVDITIDYDTGTGTPSVATAVTNLKSRSWTITLNGVAQ